ncbi:MAG: hypothetical protein U5L45_12385 [Saprospiraceae bacterium]|nr:hypothetical protein [Saprospiraceae bacterium]
MVHFSGKARKMNHLSSLCASEAHNSLRFYFSANFSSTHFKLFL